MGVDRDVVERQGELVAQPLAAQQGHPDVEHGRLIAAGAGPAVPLLERRDLLAQAGVLCQRGQARGNEPSTCPSHTN